MKIFIKNMVCQGTRRFVMMEIKKLGLKLNSFDSGELEFVQDLSPVQTCALERSLNKYGLEMILQDDFSGSLFTDYNPLGIMVDEDESFERGSMHRTELTHTV